MSVSAKGSAGKFQLHISLLSGREILKLDINDTSGRPEFIRNRIDSIVKVDSELFIRYVGQ